MDRTQSSEIIFRRVIKVMKVEHPPSAQGDIKFGALGVRRMESARA